MATRMTVEADDEMSDAQGSDDDKDDGAVDRIACAILPVRFLTAHVEVDDIAIATAQRNGERQTKT